MVSETYLSNNYDTFIGIDVDKKSFSFTIKDKGMIQRSKRIPSSPEHFYSYLKKNYPDKKILCAYEAGPTGYYLHDYLNSKNCDCIVVSPNAIPAASNEKVKNNRLDSYKIVQHLQGGTLKPIRVPEGPYRGLRHLIRVRENYTTNRKTAKQRIKGLLLHESLYQYFKESDNKWSNRYIQTLKTIPCTSAVRTRLDMLIMDLDYARRQILSSHRYLRSFVKEQVSIYRSIEYLKSIPGIGFITAATILGKIGDPIHLRNTRELASFIGLTPRERSTGETIHRGNISHLGDKRLRALLVESAWVAIRRDTELKQFYHRIASRNHPKGASQKAVVAVARKLTQRIYRVLKDQKMYIVH